MNAIAVVDENWGIGRDGKLLAHLPGDLKYFRDKTRGKTIIIGRRTFSSMAKSLLSDREAVILTGDMSLEAAGRVFHSPGDILEYVKNKRHEDLFVAGGESIYRQFYHYCDNFYITKIHASFDADRHFPNLDENPDDFTVNRLSGVIEENGFKYQFFEYIRVC